ncbi:ArsR family transcriptional regulator [Nocardia huaxiensis]|uniref:ArsR family transcriptional regulator n=1 Tax=Nocardia huaxiensis TaxID=2755382 RepID=UPI001E53FE24|nr:ArsR family transcriptional regulator [Nocardia huaxiensis]UFS96510.1 transcriptional regulator [Nocardia huaxiensis]
MGNSANELDALCELVNHRGVVEVLDALAGGPHTVRELCGSMTMRRPGVSRALRVIAARGLVSAGGAGSWDEPLEIGNPMALTDRGWRTVELLASFAVWETIYGQTDSVGDR